MPEGTRALRSPHRGSLPERESLLSWYRSAIRCQHANLLHMKRGIRKRLGLALAVGGPLALAIGLVALVIDGRRVVSAAREAAQRRPLAKALATTELPHGGAVGSYWGAMVPFQGGALTIGNG